MTAEGATEVDVESWRLFQHQLRRRGERRLVLLEGDRTASLAWLRRLVPALNPEAGLWVGPEPECPDPHLAALAPKNARQWLGRESTVVVWDGWQGNPPDAFAALSGTLQAGGLLFWLVPPLAQWRGFEDPDYSRTGLDGLPYHPFADRMADILASESSVIRITPADQPNVAPPSLPEPGHGFTVGSTNDQRVLVERLVKFGLGRRRRPLVITADRGRGKSAALGLAAAELLRQGRQQVLVTAPSSDQVATLFRHARESLEGELVSVSDVCLETRGGGCLRFLEVRELLTEKPEAEVVLVDEAAAIPAPLLKQVLLGWPRVAYSTTVHGYEGSGRGFAIRFRQVLDRETPHWQSVALAEPVRWSRTDPLEPLMARLFLLGAENQAVGEAVTAGDIVIEPFSPGEVDDSALGEAFGLLVDAHYRTTPADLRQWMDASAGRSWRARVGEATVGILWGAVEGGLAPELAEQVTLGQRRLRGHLLPQSLASHSGFPEAAGQRCLRVIRVAVSDQARRLGIGRKLVAAASESARREGLDTLGTSFGGSTELLAFWQACGLHLVRLGLNQEATSGEYPVQMLQGVSEVGQGLVNRLRDRQAGHWLDLLPLAWSSLEPRLLAALTAGMPAIVRLNDQDRRDLHSFARGHRGFLLTLPVLRRTALVGNVMPWLAAQGELALWVAAVLQQRPWGRLQSDGLCLGQRDGEDRLRALTRELLQNGPEL